MSFLSQETRAREAGAAEGLIRGALGSADLELIRSAPSLKKRLKAFLAVAGPGLIVMVGDNDAGGVASYAQAGQNFGYALFWVVLLLIPVLIIAQEMVARLGAVSGVGHARLIRERFGKVWAWFSVIDLFLLNFLTLLTEFIGIGLAGRFFGISAFLSVPVAAALLIAITASGRFTTWERRVYLLILVSLVEFPLMFISHPNWTYLAKGLFVPGLGHGALSSSLSMVVALIGTTIAPWQLFFQQSNVIDKRITPRWLSYERADTISGAFLTNVAAIAIMAAAAFGLAHTPAFGNFTDGLGVARALSKYVSYTAGALFAILLFDAAVLGATTVTLSSSYAYGDLFGVTNSLDKPFREARAFYGFLWAQIVLAAGVVLIPGFPLGLVTYGVQILAGVLLSPSLLFLLILCNDRELLGPWVNGRWLNVITAVLLYLLTFLSFATTGFSIAPNADLVLIVGLSAAVALPLLFVLVYNFGLKDRSKRGAVVDREWRLSWRSPALAALNPYQKTGSLRAVMVGLRTYVGVGMVGVVVEIARLALH